MRCKLWISLKLLTVVLGGSLPSKESMYRLACKHIRVGSMLPATPLPAYPGLSDGGVGMIGSIHQIHRPNIILVGVFSRLMILTGFRVAWVDTIHMAVNFGL